MRTLATWAEGDERQGMQGSVLLEEGCKERMCGARRGRVPASLPSLHSTTYSANLPSFAPSSVGPKHALNPSPVEREHCFFDFSCASPTPQWVVCSNLYFLEGDAEKRSDCREDREKELPHWTSHQKPAHPTHTSFLFLQEETFWGDKVTSLFLSIKKKINISWER